MTSVSRSEALLIASSAVGMFASTTQKINGSVTCSAFYMK